MPVNERIIPTSGTPINPGGIRQLTIGEIALAKTLYGYSIHYHLVWVHRESYLPFNLQPVDIAMSPNGEMWFREETYSPDFSLEDDGNDSNLLIVFYVQIMPDDFVMQLHRF